MTMNLKQSTLFQMSQSIAQTGDSNPPEFFLRLLSNPPPWILKIQQPLWMAKNLHIFVSPVYKVLYIDYCIEIICLSPSVYTIISQY